MIITINQMKYMVLKILLSNSDLKGINSHEYLITFIHKHKIDLIASVLFIDLMFKM